MATPNPGPGLLGHGSERALLDLPVNAVRAGESQALVLRGEPRVGRSALRVPLFDQLEPLPTPQRDALATAVGGSAVVTVGFLRWSFDGCDRTLHPCAQRESDDSICDSLVAALKWLRRRA